MAKTQQYGNIVSGGESELHDEPYIEGSRITVQFIQKRVEGRGLEPQTVALRHDLDVTAVYEALAYYHSHPDEIRAIEQARRQAEEEYEHLTHDPDEVTK
ncbi:DUF433 domain-containing protein [Halobacteriales archaeon SW_7_68_16]|nr:MAG: DUF433 domain-containing protein [Halobacteriales archaeon SW_7_68_16]